MLLHTTWGEWKTSNPQTIVLSPKTSFRNNYWPIRVGVFNQQESLFGDDRLQANALAIGVEIEGEYKGYPLEELRGTEGVINDVLAGQPIVVIYNHDAQGGLAYSRSVNGQDLKFYNSEAKGI